MSNPCIRKTGSRIVKKDYGKTLTSVYIAWVGGMVPGTGDAAFFHGAGDRVLATCRCLTTVRSVRLDHHSVLVHTATAQRRRRITSRFLLKSATINTSELLGRFRQHSDKNGWTIFSGWLTSSEQVLCKYVKHVKCPERSVRYIW